jgi:hypothetical protein
VPLTNAEELRENIARFETLLGAQRTTRERLLERRRGASPAVMGEVDDRLMLNQETMEAIEHAMSRLRAQLAELDRAKSNAVRAER